MSQKSSAPPTRVPAEKLVRDIRGATRKHHAAKDKIRIILEDFCFGEGIENIENYGSETFAFSVPFPTPLILPNYLIILGYWDSPGVYPHRRPIPAPPLAAIHPCAGSGTRNEFLMR